MAKAPDAKPQKTFEAYAAGFPPDVEMILMLLRDAIREVAPDATEAFKYGMPVFHYEGTYLYVAAWKKHIGLYPVFPAAPALEKQIAPYRAEKDTVQLPYAKPIPYDLVKKIAKARMKDAKA
jgi:uncharacterized protein YdhG (YjbR/CyaY superfamily)